MNVNWISAAVIPTLALGPVRSDDEKMPWAAVVSNIVDQRRGTRPNRLRAG